MAKILYSLGDAYVIGEREHYEDAVQVESGLRTAGGLTLEVAIVCDGVGGRDAGEVAAQTAISVIMRMLSSSPETHVPTLLRKSVEQANGEVNRLGNGGKCTLALAVIVHDGSPFGRLYIASVGDSRIGMVRTVDKDNRLHETRSIAWMNRVHNVAEDQIMQGVEPQVAYRVPNAHALTRVLGLYNHIKVDQGFYYKAPDTATAFQRGEEGLALRTADTIFVCSDGMLDRSPIDREPVVSEEKFLRHTLDVNAKDASKLLVSIAQGRKTQDNASLGMIIVDPESRHRRITTSNRLAAPAIAAVIVLAIATFVLLGLLNSSNQQIDVAAQTLTQANQRLTVVGNEVTQAALNTAQAIASFTATPTATLTPTPTPLPVIRAGSVGEQWTLASLANPIQFKANETLGSSQFSVVTLWGKDPNYQAHAYINQNASLKVSSVDQSSGSFALLLQTGGVLVETGSFNELSVRSSGYNAEFLLSGSCMIVEHEPATLSMACLDGTCSYMTAIGEIPVPLPVGKKIIFGKDQSAPQIAALRFADVSEYFTDMETVGGQIGRIDRDECRLRSYAPAVTKTPTTAPTIIAPTSAGAALPACPGNLVSQNGTCVCSSGMVRSGDQCVQPTQVSSGQGGGGQSNTGQQIKPPTAIPSCTGGQTWNGSACVCPSGKTWNGSACVDPEPPSCPAGQHVEGNICVDNPPPTCSETQHLEGNICVDNPPPTCSETQHLEGNVCVDNPPPTCSENQHLEGNVCVDNPPPTDTESETGAIEIGGIRVDLP